MRTRASLVAHTQAGARLKYLFFWGHTAKRDDVVESACLSQWFPRAFVVDGVAYASAEHYMMAEKARIFGDAGARARVLAASSPAEAKAIGREVQPFDSAVWERDRFDVVVAGNYAKFGQHDDLRRFLLATGERVLVEASPRDRVWGIGMTASNPDAADPSKWLGENLLGFALMEARARLAAA